MDFRKQILISASLIGLLAGAQAPVLAQSEASERMSMAGADIIVTAQKREERLSDVGLTISALGEDALSERNIQSLSDIAAAVPGLYYTTSSSNTPVYNLRGVGFYDTSTGSYPTTSIYLDQVPLPFPVLTTLTAFDLQRIEVLKGPQGTLFGQNSTGGAINYIANKPTDELAAGIEMSYGRFNDINGTAYISGPLSSTLRARIAVRGQHAGPWQYSYTRHGQNPGWPNTGGVMPWQDSYVQHDENGRMENLAGRILVDWTPSDTLKFELNVNGWINKNEPTAAQFQGIIQQDITNVLPEMWAYPKAPNNARAADWSPQNGMYANDKLGQISLRGDWEFLPDIVLTSITSYIGYRERGAMDNDGMIYEDVDIRFRTGHIKSFSQELRIANTDDGPIRWVVGANYSRDKVYHRENLLYGDSSGGNNQVAPYQIESSENWSNQRMRNYAFFGNVDYDLSEYITVKGGVRYTNSRRTSNICNMDGTVSSDGGPGRRNYPVGGTNRLFDLLADMLAPGNDYPDISPNGCFNLNDPDPLNPMANPERPYEPGVFVGNLRENNVSWRAGIDLKPSEDVLLYVNVAKGYKAGGYGNINTALNVQLRPAVQESILSYEGGFKVQALERTLSLNGAVFYMDYKNKQLRTKDINPIFGIIDALNNVPKSSVWGFELEANARPVEGLSVGFSATYLDAKIKDYEGVNAGGVIADFEGTVMPYTPKWQLAMDGRYEFPLHGDVRGFISGQFNHRSKTFASIGGSFDSTKNMAPGYVMASYVTVDGQIGVRSDSGWRAYVWGKNITNAYYWDNVFGFQDNLVRYAARPATYGITLGFDL